MLFTCDIVPNINLSLFSHLLIQPVLQYGNNYYYDDYKMYN